MITIAEESIVPGVDAGELALKTIVKKSAHYDESMSLCPDSIQSAFYSRP